MKNGIFFKKCLVFSIFFLLINIPFMYSLSAESNHSNSHAYNLRKLSVNNNEIFYIGDLIINFTKGFSGYSKRAYGNFSGYIIHVDSSVDEFNCEIRLNYSVDIDNTQSDKFFLQPIELIGLKVENYTDYKWNSFKLKNYGYELKEGNISIELSIDVETFESGDMLVLKTRFCEMSVPFLGCPSYDYYKLWEFLFRFFYNIPFLNSYLFYNCFIPILEPDNSMDFSRIYIYFD